MTIEEKVKLIEKKYNINLIKMFTLNLNSCTDCRDPNCNISDCSDCSPCGQCS